MWDNHVYREARKHNADIWNMSEIITSAQSKSAHTKYCINPLAGNLLVRANNFCDSATKRSRTEEVDTAIGYSSPGGKKIGKLVYKTPDKKGDLDAFSTLSGTGLSKDYPHYKRRFRKKFVLLHQQRLQRPNTKKCNTT